MPLAFGGQFAKTIIERHEVEGRGEQKSRAQRAGEEHLQIEIEERSRSKKWRRRGCGACKKGRAEDAKNGPMKIVLIGPFGRGNHRLSGVDFKRFRMSS